MENVAKFINGELMIQIGLWTIFVAGLMFTILDEISLLGIMATLGMLLMAIDFPRKEKRKK